MLGHCGLRNAIFIHKRPYDVNGFLRCHGLLFSRCSFFSAILMVKSLNAALFCKTDCKLLDSCSIDSAPSFEVHCVYRFVSNSSWLMFWLGY